MSPSQPSRYPRIRLATWLGASLLFPSAAAAESASAEYDAEVELVADPPAVEPEGQSTLHLVLRNRGDFGLDDAVVAVTLSPTLELLKAETDRGAYDPDSGRWTTGEVLSFDVAELTLLVRLRPGASAGTAVADLAEAEASFSAYDRDSTPGNDDPCEDDHAFTNIALLDAPDASPGEADAGVLCSGRPDAGSLPDRPDAGDFDASAGGADPDAGPSSGDEEGCGCTGAGDAAVPTGLAVLLAVLAAHLPTRRARRPPSA